MKNISLFSGQMREDQSKKAFTLNFIDQNFLELFEKFFFYSLAFIVLYITAYKKGQILLKSKFFVHIY